MVKFFHLSVNVRIHVFYISRIALLTCFRKINKIENMEYINDLLIQLYEFKREKARNKRLRNSRSKNPPPVRPSNWRMFRMLWYLKWFGIFSTVVIGIGALILKFFFWWSLYTIVYYLYLFHLLNSRFVSDSLFIVQQEP